MTEMIEQVARAMEPSAFRTYDAGYTQRNGHDLRAFLNAERTVKTARRKARAAIEATRDWLDEHSDRYVGAMIDLALTEPTP